MASLVFTCLDFCIVDLGLFKLPKLKSLGQ